MMDITLQKILLAVWGIGFGIAEIALIATGKTFAHAASQLKVMAVIMSALCAIAGAALLIQTIRRELRTESIDEEK